MKDNRSECFVSRIVINVGSVLLTEKNKKSSVSIQGEDVVAICFEGKRKIQGMKRMDFMSKSSHVCMKKEEINKNNQIRQRRDKKRERKNVHH